MLTPLVTRFLIGLITRLLARFMERRSEPQRASGLVDISSTEPGLPENTSVKELVIFHLMLLLADIVKRLLRTTGGPAQLKLGINGYVTSQRGMTVSAAQLNVLLRFSLIHSRAARGRERSLKQLVGVD